MNVILKYGHLLLSTLIVIPVAFIYGANPSEILPQVFGFEVVALELKNIFRAILGLYLFMASYWFFGLLNSKHFKTATLVNILFMGGLAFGRILSTFLDGVSIQFTQGLITELILAAWGIYNLRCTD